MPIKNKEHIKTFIVCLMVIDFILVIGQANRLLYIYHHYDTTIAIKCLATLVARKFIFLTLAGIALTHAQENEN